MVYWQLRLEVRFLPVVFSFLSGGELDGMPPWNNALIIKLGDLQIASTSKQT